MLDIRRFTIIYFTTLYLLFRFTGIHYFVLVVAAVLYIGVLVFGSFYIGSNFYLKPICSVKSDEKKIAITFDDGPDEEITPKVLDALEKFGIKAAFFCVGKKISAHPELLKKMNELGHIVGNHTYSHSNWFDFYSAKRMTRELEQTDKVIHDLVGEKVRFFRPPFGVTNPALAKAVKKINYITIGWDVRSLDTGKGKKADKIIARIIRQLKPGSIILLHDKNPEIGLILEELVKYANDNGYEIVRLDKLINQEAYV